MSPCLLCGHNALSDIPKPGGLPGVTSDDRIWPSSGDIACCTACGHVQKRIGKTWEEDTAKVYGGYALYRQSGGLEHASFSGGTPKPRSHLLLENLRRTLRLPARGRMLDVGCGSGPLLRSFGAMFPGWSLTGFEPDDRHRMEVQKLPGVEGFHSGAVEDIPGSFDLIVLYYVLEHLPRPAQTIATLRSKLTANGVLAAVVPNYLENPFDLLIVDHCSHFDPDTLPFFLTNLDLEILAPSSDWIPRAVTVVARNTPRKPLPQVRKTSARTTSTEARKRVEWLERLAADAGRRAAAGTLGIFGTATAGSWLAGVLGERAKFFVDEDPARTGAGKSHLGRPVYPPAEVPPHEAVYLALPPALAQTLFTRLTTAYPRMKSVLPPPA